MICMRNLFLLFVLVTTTCQQTFAWGQTGHRVIGQIATWHLNKRAQKNINKLLGPETLAMSGTWMDEVRSDSTYNYMVTWHYLTIPGGEQYDVSKQDAGGNAYATLQTIVAGLKSDTLSAEDEVVYLRILVHLVGDLHQPLHVGTGEDKGGNDVKVRWMGGESNLHRVWDSDMIDSKQLSYTELATYLNRFITKDKAKQWQSVPFSQWLSEDMALRETVYDIPEDHYLSYHYAFKNYPVVEQRLLMAGVRLAGILNDIYG